MAGENDNDASGNAAHLLSGVLRVAPGHLHPTTVHGGGPAPKIGAYAYALAGVWLAERAVPHVDPRDIEMFDHFVALAKHQLRVGKADTTQQGALFKADAKKSSRIPCKIGIWSAHEVANWAWRAMYAGGAARPAFANWARHLLKKAPQDLGAFVTEVDALCIHLEVLTLLEDREEKTSKPIVATLWRGCDQGKVSHFLMRLEDGTFALFGKQGGRWRMHEGKRDDVISTVPDQLFAGAARAAST